MDVMVNLRKIAIFIIVFAGVTSFSFADTLYSFSTGLIRLNEQYPDEDYGRDLDGFSLNFMLNHYKENSPLGWFVRTSFGGLMNGYEWTEDDWDWDSDTALSYTGFRISTGPSFRIRVGSLIQIPISIGPVFSTYRKQGSYWQSHNYPYANYHIVVPEPKDPPVVEDPPIENPPIEYPPEISPSYHEDYYETFNFGVLCDAAFIINPFGRLTFINGISISWEFLHWEKNYGSSPLSYRNTANARLRNPNYSAITVDFYFGVGILLGNTPHRRGNNQRDSENNQ
jgi:hypothetical protein